MDLTYAQRNSILAASALALIVVAYFVFTGGAGSRIDTSTDPVFGVRDTVARTEATEPATEAPASPAPAAEPAGPTLTVVDPAAVRSEPEETTPTTRRASPAPAPTRPTTAPTTEPPTTDPSETTEPTTPSSETTDPSETTEPTTPSTEEQTEATGRGGAPDSDDA